MKKVLLGLGVSFLLASVVKAEENLVLGQATTVVVLQSENADHVLQNTSLTHDIASCMKEVPEFELLANDIIQFSGKLTDSPLMNQEKASVTFIVTYDKDVLKKLEEGKFFDTYTQLISGIDFSYDTSTGHVRVTLPLVSALITDALADDNTEQTHTLVTFAQGIEGFQNWSKHLKEALDDVAHDRVLDPFTAGLLMRLLSLGNSFDMARMVLGQFIPDEQLTLLQNYKTIAVQVYDQDGKHLTMLQQSLDAIAEHSLLLAKRCYANEHIALQIDAIGEKVEELMDDSGL